ncbi:IS3 family transposase, partial [Burkholderia cenocepacia]|uniref:IS3 family transposase n=4 Tax=Burkholderia cenocepacia TaxID=95486 RepID=UPI001F090D19
LKLWTSISGPFNNLVLRRPVESTQYASRAHRNLAAEFGMTVSMSRRANAWDNAPMESFFKTLKVERIYQTRYETRAQARLDIVDWIEGYYNQQRMHTSIDYLTPVEYETRRDAA